MATRWSSEFIVAEHRDLQVRVSEDVCCWVYFFVFIMSCLLSGSSASCSQTQKNFKFELSLVPRM
jgi:hypothetical protein